MVSVFLFLLHLSSFRDPDELDVVGIAIIPRLDGVVTFVADEVKPLRHLTLSIETFCNRQNDRLRSSLTPRGGRCNGRV